MEAKEWGKMLFLGPLYTHQRNRSNVLGKATRSPFPPRFPISQDMGAGAPVNARPTSAMRVFLLVMMGRDNVD